MDYESHATALDRNEIGSLLVTAGLGNTADHALISLLALNGLRISEALGANIQALGTERGHRTLTVVRKGGNTVTIPLAPRTARAIDLTGANESRVRSSCAAMGSAWDGTPRPASCTAPAKQAGLGAKKISPHTLRHAFITAALDALVPLRDVPRGRLPR